MFFPANVVVSLMITVSPPGAARRRAFLPAFGRGLRCSCTILTKKILSFAQFRCCQPCRLSVRFSLPACRCLCLCHPTRRVWPRPCRHSTSCFETPHQTRVAEVARPAGKRRRAGGRERGDARTRDGEGRVCDGQHGGRGAVVRLRADRSAMRGCAVNGLAQESLGIHV